MQQALPIDSQCRERPGPGGRAIGRAARCSAAVSTVQVSRAEQKLANSRTPCILPIQGRWASTVQRAGRACKRRDGRPGTPVAVRPSAWGAAPSRPLIRCAATGECDGRASSKRPALRPACPRATQASTNPYLQRRPLASLPGPSAGRH